MSKTAESQTRKYGSLIVLDTKGNETSVDDLVGAVAKDMEAEGAKLDEIKQLGRRTFAYNARHLDGGHYVNYIFEAEPQQIEKIQERLKLNKLVHIQHYERLA
ncbi:MAG: 30S ribosomal protein S6 [Akkermansiaceae bacterium]|nr:30S ribosomal protein S6 [Akkermansiaceae bacterium]NNM29685.1 30S ribosomal protein S6 [Akkermansiaceae bacterium]